MKRTLSLLLALTLVLTTIGCGTDTKEPSEPNNKVESEKEPASDTEVKENESVAEKKLQTIMAPAGTFYVDCEYELNKKESGLTTLLYKTEDSVVGVSDRVDKVYNGAIKDVANEFSKCFISAAAMASSGYLHGEEFNIKSTEEVTIAGRECVQFTATVKNMNTWECYIYGYAFVIDTVPCAVIGLVSAESQDSALIEEINARVDEIMNTVRTTE